MIPAWKIKRTLEKESHFWKRRATTEFINGIIFGINRSRKLIDELPNYRWVMTKPKK